jgi:hypothetical protein
MKKFISVPALLMCQLLFVSVCSAQDKKEQLWLVGEEVVKPEMLNQYLELNKELLALCIKDKFPFTFNLWTSGDFKYYLWYPIESMNDVTKISAAWDSIVTHYGTERFKRFSECVEYSIDKFTITRLDLSYKPPESRLKDGEGTYCHWQEFYLKKGSEKYVEALINKATATFRDKKYNDAIYFGYGKVGYENPVLFNWGFGKSITDFYEQDKKYETLFGEELKDIKKEFTTYVRKVEKKDVWWLKNLSYNPIK